MAPGRDKPLGLPPATTPLSHPASCPPQRALAGEPAPLHPSRGSTARAAALPAAPSNARCRRLAPPPFLGTTAGASGRPCGTSRRGAEGAERLPGCTPRARAGLSLGGSSLPRQQALQQPRHAPGLTTPQVRHSLVPSPLRSALTASPASPSGSPTLPGAPTQGWPRTSPTLPTAVAISPGVGPGEQTPRPFCPRDPLGAESSSAGTAFGSPTTPPRPLPAIPPLQGASSLPSSRIFRDAGIPLPLPGKLPQGSISPGRSHNPSSLA